MAGRNLKPGGFDSTDKMHSNTLKVKNISVMFGPMYAKLKLEEKEEIQCTQLICELFNRGSQCNVSLLKLVVSAFIFQGSDSPGSHNRLRGGGRRQNQNSLLVKGQNDNTSPGDWPRKISP